MSIRDSARGDDGSKQTANRRLKLKDEQIEEITGVVLQAIEVWSKAKEQHAKQTNPIRRAARWLRTKSAWIIVNLTAFVLLSSILLFIYGIRAYEVSPDQIVKGSITPYQEAQLKEDMVQRQLDM